MYLTLLILPLLSSLINGFLGRKVGRRGAEVVVLILMGSALILVLMAYYEVVLCQSPVLLSLGSWSSLVHLEAVFLFDDLSVSMMIPVLIVSSFVHIYSFSYMAGDPHYQRFLSYLSFFTFAMMLMVVGENWLLFFTGWEAIGLASYLLIGFWFTRIKASHYALKAFLMNRVGDTFLFLAMVLGFWMVQDFGFSTFFSLLPYLNEEYLLLFALLMLIGVMSKSGQFGLHAWLPQAMEGATPVSALIHAATLVTAGIYLLLRFSTLFGYSSVLLWLGGFTALFGAVYAFLQTDLKRTIAYSTTSQLGYMVVACGLGQYPIALAHLINHAFFKSLLFLSAGLVIHAVHDEQDMRKLGGLARLLPVSYATTLIGSLALVALPFTTGFYSKDLIVQSSADTLAYCFTLMAALFTGLYSIKLLYAVFWSEPRSKVILKAQEHITFTTIVLAFLSIFGGYALQYVSYPSLFVHPNNAISIHHLAWWTAFLPLTGLVLSPFLWSTVLNIPILRMSLWPAMNLGLVLSRYLDYGFLRPQHGVRGLNQLAERVDLSVSSNILFTSSLFVLLISFLV